jgi:two-component system, OmpR family, phosphate regulon sensor histidine kinase PhoR
MNGGWAQRGFLSPAGWNWLTLRRIAIPMAVQEQRREAYVPGGLWRRFALARPALLVAGAIFAGLIAFAGLGTVPALVGFAAIALVVLVREAGKPSAGSGLLYGQAAVPAITERLVEAVLSALPDPAIALSPDSIVVAFNASLQRITPGILRGEPISFALRVPEVLEAIRAVAARGDVHRVEFFQRVPTDRWWEATIAPLDLPSDDGKQQRQLVLMSLRDLTPLRRVEEMRADFVANASHELRTPLASLSGFIETLQGPARNDEPSRDRFLDIMKAQATRMARLIDDLLSLSRIEQKAHIHPDGPIDLAAIVRQVADGLSPLAREREVEVKIAEAASSMIVPGDRDEIMRVFENLIENALKYGAAGKRVDITLAREPPTGQPRDVVIAVRDYGPGIAPEHLPRLTERFYRVDIGESRAQGGTGLGLALVKHILNRHRGRLAIESTPGEGANFIVRLPLLGNLRPDKIPR